LAMLWFKLLLHIALGRSVTFLCEKG